MDALAGERPRPDPRPRLTLLIVSHIRFLREALASILGREPLLSVVGLAADRDEAVAVEQQTAPDILLLDARLPEGLSAVRHLRACAPAARIVALAVDETEDNVIACAEAGADGYVASTVPLTDLAAVITAAARGEQSCSAAVAGALLRRIANGASAAGGHAPPPVLTARETQVLGLICAGLSNKDIARRLNIEVATVKSHVHNLLAKLKLQRRSQATVWMREHEPDLPAPSPPSLSGPDLGSSVPGGDTSSARP